MRKNLVILGAGAAGTALANRMRHALDEEWQVTVIDGRGSHLYQPGLVFLPFESEEEPLERPRANTLADGVEWICDQVLALDPVACQVRLSAITLRYDFLVVASGCEPRPDLTPGLVSRAWGESAFDFYTLEGARALRGALARFERGRLVVGLGGGPVKGPSAALELAFLADAWLRKRHRREGVELVYATPDQEIGPAVLEPLLAARGIRVERGLRQLRADGDQRVLEGAGRQVPWDLLAFVPRHGGARFVERSYLGDAQGFIPTDPRTLEARGHERIFVIGDASDAPAPKLAWVAGFQAELCAENLLRVMRGRPAEPTFDGHAHWIVETGQGRALAIDSSYDAPPMPGEFPWAGIGPLKLLGESRLNHWGKLAGKWLYWNRLLAGKSLPIPNQHSMAGKHPLAGAAT